MVWMHLRSSNLIRQLLGDDPRPTRRPWRSPYFGWRARPPALIRTRSPGASDCFDSVSVFVAELMSLHSFTCITTRDKLLWRSPEGSHNLCQVTYSIEIRKILTFLADSQKGRGSSFLSRSAPAKAPELNPVP